MTEFHWRDGWWFSRDGSGNIHIYRHEDAGYPQNIDLEIAPGEWLSILKALNPRADAEPTTPAGSHELATERRPNSGFDSRDGGHLPVFPSSLIVTFEDHYWDTFQKDRELILLHVRAVLREYEITIARARAELGS